jgi:hypothetical protein
MHMNAKKENRLPPTKRGKVLVDMFFPYPNFKIHLREGSQAHLSCKDLFLAIKWRFSILLAFLSIKRQVNE